MKRILFTAAIAAAIAGPAVSENYYEGKTITYIIATSPGGGYDAYGRLIGNYLGEQLGADRVIFNNLPGAGHIIGANTLFASDPDGLTIGTFNTGLIYAQILGQEGIRFDLNEFSWVGKASSDARTMVLSSNSGLASFDDLIAAPGPVLFAASGVGSANYTETKLLADGLDLNIQMIPGYNGNEGEMAMMRGEVVGQVASLESLRPFVDGGNGFFALAVGGDMQPQAIDYATTDKGRAIVSLIDANSNLGRLTAAPPGVPDEILEELRDAYMAVLTDPAFLADAEKLSLSIDPGRGDVVAEQVRSALLQSPETTAIIAAALEVEIPTVTVTSDILSLEDGNKVVGFMNGEASVAAEVSGSRTTLTINGESAERSALMVGMNCEFTYDPATDPLEFKVATCTGEVMAEAEPTMMMVTSAILSLEDDGKVVGFTGAEGEMTGEISGSRTALTIDGAEADREALTVGMTCDFAYAPNADGIEFASAACTQ